MGENDMIRTRRIAVLTLAMLSVFSLDACKKKPAPVTAPTPSGPDTAGAGARARAEQARRDSIARADALRLAAQRRQDSINAANAASSASAADAANLRATLVATIQFDYDQSDLRDDARSNLDAKARILQANPGVTLRIAGHTDERGSDEYNLALGQRRAGTTKKYLVDRGIADARIQTVSYGEERPVAQGSDESAFSQNRRAEFEITAGGSSPLRKP
jgi:peptidoglycan-associated lipoprotein